MLISCSTMLRSSRTSCNAHSWCAPLHHPSQTMCSGVCITCHRAGELSAQELEQLMVIVSNPRTFKV